MDSFYRPTWVEISLDALRHNVTAFRKVLPEPMHIMAVVKADAYGHGAVQVAQEAIRAGASYLAVAFLDEALELRRAGITEPILVLGYTSAFGVKLAAEYKVTINVYSDEVLAAIAEQIDPTTPLNIHVKLDTGMGRLGLQDENEAVAFIERAMAIPGVTVQGLFTHFACADETDKTYTYEQHGRFDRIVEHFRGKGISFPYLHTGNSATAIDLPDLTYNMVRLGISMYGLYPSEDVNQSRVELHPVMSMKTAVVMIKTMPEGAGISYGATYRTKANETIATLPVGYADGYTRLLTGKTEALVHGKRVPVVGRICMDQCMVDVSAVEGVKVGDEVVLFGLQGEEEIPVEELAHKIGTIPYEIICMVSHRVPRVYTKGGKVVNTVNPLQHLV
jgi:alanine racemase